MSYAVLRIEKVKSLAGVGSRAAHNLRASQKAAPHADPSKRGGNVVLMGPNTAPEQVTEAVKGRLATVPKVRSNAVLAVEVVMTASSEFFTDKQRGPKDWAAWRDNSMQWLRDTFGADNIASAVMHRDERTPHIQAIVVPVANGRLNASHWLDGPKKLAHLQDTYAGALEPLRLRRGVKGSKAKHTSLREFYRLADSIAKTVKGAGQRAPKLPARGILGHVSASDWAQLQTDLERYGAEGMRLRAEATAARVLMDSAVGRELVERKAQAERDLAKVQADLAKGQALLDGLRTEFNTLDQVINDKAKAAAVPRPGDSRKDDSPPQNRGPRQRG